jgi:nicotinamidase/pyrazinamidase
MGSAALIIVDVQNDFLPGGPLAVPGGNAVVPVINGIVDRFDLVVATQDWHPPSHGSFAASHPGRSPGEVIDLHGLPQVLWPTHCVRGTPGADLAAGLVPDRIEAIFRKGTDPAVDSYSGLFDNGHRRRTGLADYLRGRGVTEVAVCGLATDYCVKFTALDAVAEGFAVTLVEDACRGVDLHPGDVAAALAELRTAGVRVVASDAV